MIELCKNNIQKAYGHSCLSALEFNDKVKINDIIMGFKEVRVGRKFEWKFPYAISQFAHTLGKSVF